MKKAISALIILIIGAVLGFSISFTKHAEIQQLIDPSAQSGGEEAKSAKKEPLYWVAPMDANYRRDKPGKSPMGMDLVPVYEEDVGSGDAGPGTVKISPEVINNLGVRTAGARMGELHSFIKTVGFVEYDQEQLVHVHPRVKGWIEKLYIEATGDPVRRGQPLYDIYSPELVNAQEELSLALQRNNQRLIRAAELRLQALRVPQQIIANIKRSGDVQQNITFHSPQTGVVDDLVIREGFYVQPGSTIMSIGSLDQVWVEAEVFERQASLVKVGQPVTMELDYQPGKVWKGTVDYIYPTLDSKTRTVRVRLIFANADRLLKPNMFARVVIDAEIEEKTLLVPKEAIIRTGLSNRVVLALGDGRFKSVNVEVGRYDTYSAEILSGIGEGEEVVTSAQFLIDSESSKNSDFKRMHHEEGPPPPKSVWSQATINSVIPAERKINATHGEIPLWDWPEMTMDFQLGEGVESAEFAEGKKINIEITKTADNTYEITGVHDPTAEDTRSLDDLSLDDMSLDDMKLE